MDYDPSKVYPLNELQEMLDICPDFVYMHSDRHGGTSLHAHVSHNLYEQAKLLLESGANVDALNEYGITPLFLVRSIEMLDLLIDYGANVLVKTIYNEVPLFEMYEPTLFEKFLKHMLSRDPNHVDERLYVIHAMDQYTSSKIVKILLDHKALDPNYKTNYNTSYGVLLNCKMSDKKFKLLLEYKADPNTLVHVRNLSYISPHRLDLLIDHKIDPFIENTNGQTILHRVINFHVSRDNETLVKKLLEHAKTL